MTYTSKKDGEFAGNQEFKLKFNGLLLTQVKYLILAISMLIVGNAKAQSKIDWQTDLSFIAEELPKKHYNLFAKKDKDYFTSELDKIKNELIGKSDLNIALQIQQLLASMGDSHTGLDYKTLLNKKEMLPLQLHYFKDGLFVLCTSNNYGDLAGNKILAINKMPINMVEQKIGSLIVVDNEAIIKKDIPQYLPFTQLLQYLDIVKDNKIELEYQLPKGEIKHITMETHLVDKNKACIQPTYKPNEVALCYKNQKQFFTSDNINEHNLVYLQYNRCWSKELEMQFGDSNKAEKLPSFEEFEKDVTELLGTKNIEKIVFDMRFNSGGNSLQGTQFIDKLANYAKERTNIKIYVILGRHTFSSAILNALDFKKMIPNTIFVGEETAGKPNHFGELKSLQLPSSKLNLFYSTKYFKRVDKDVNSLIPDVKIESTFSDFMKGIDPVYEWIKSN